MSRIKLGLHIVVNCFHCHFFHATVCRCRWDYAD